MGGPEPAVEVVFDGDRGEPLDFCCRPARRRRQGLPELAAEDLADE
jgi:hypothetical protein